MMIFRKKQRSVCCSGVLLFQILDDNLRDGLCTDILFLYHEKPHRFGAYGDQANTYKNVVFYLDRSEFRSRDAILQEGMIDGVRLAELQNVCVYECDGCYPESTPRLRKLMEQSEQLEYP